MNRTPFAVALLCALVGMGLLVLYKQRLESETAGGRRIAVLMARKAINLGERIVEEDLGVRYLPEAYIDARHIRAGDQSTVIGVRASNEIRPNESLLWTDLASGGAQARKLSNLVRPGLRAVAVPFASAFGGLLRPGDRVDVLMTVENPSTGMRQTATFEQNLLVLAVDDDMGSGHGGGGRGALATLAVTADQGQRLTLAQTTSALSLLLRNPEDLRTIEAMPETRRSDLLVLGGRAPVPRPPGSLPDYSLTAPGGLASPPGAAPAAAPRPFETARAAASRRP